MSHLWHEQSLPLQSPTHEHGTYSLHSSLFWKRFLKIPFWVFFLPTAMTTLRACIATDTGQVNHTHLKPLSHLGHLNPLLITATPIAVSPPARQLCTFFDHRDLRPLRIRALASPAPPARRATSLVATSRHVRPLTMRAMAQQSVPYASWARDSTPSSHSLHDGPMSAVRGGMRGAVSGSAPCHHSLREVRAPASMLDC